MKKKSASAEKAGIVPSAPEIIQKENGPTS